MGKYITDPEGFGQFASTTAFKEYVDYVIRPSYELHGQLGLLRRERPAALATETKPARAAYAFNVTFSNFLSARCASPPIPTPPAGLLAKLERTHPWRAPSHDQVRHAHASLQAAVGRGHGQWCLELVGEPPGRLRGLTARQRPRQVRLRRRGTVRAHTTSLNPHPSTNTKP